MELIQMRVVSKNVELAGKGRVELDLVVLFPLRVGSADRQTGLVLAMPT